MNLLTLTDLSVSYGDFLAVNKVSLSINAGMFAALVGGSGSGKSTLAHAILQLNDAATVTGSVCFDGRELTALSAADWLSVRGGQIAMIFQEPMTSLNPLHRVGKQIAEALKLHGLTADIQTVLDLLKEVDLPDVERIAKSFPHELSGGQRQRVMIAMALAGQPKLLIADEPTTALDVTVQAQILKLLKRLQQKRNLTVLLITHDLNVVRRYADTVFVLEGGRLTGTTVPPAETPRFKTVVPQTKKVLTVRDLNVRYGKLHAVQNVSFDLHRGETIGLAGESGSGKSSVGQALMRLIPATGQVLLNCADYFDLGGAALKAARAKMQMVLQDPAGSLNPRMRVADMIGEGLSVHEPKLSRTARYRRIIGMMKQLDLPIHLHNRYPHELSGGQKVRVALARVLILNPAVLILDEVTTALDKKTADQIIELLLSYQRRTGLAYIFISHDLSVLARMSDTLIILQNGQVVETGKAAHILRQPVEPYTKSLVQDAFLTV